MLSGTLQTIPMSGAKTVLLTERLGQVVVYEPVGLDPADGKRLGDLERTKAKVKVAGVILVMCTEKEVKDGVVGCFWLDPASVITVERD